MDDVIGDQTTLSAAAYSSDPAQHDLVLTPAGPTLLVYIVVLAVFKEDVMQGHTTVHGHNFDPDLATGTAGQATQSTSIHHPNEDGHY